MRCLCIKSSTDVHVTSSPYDEIDQLHLAFWEECVDRSIPPMKFEHVISFIPPSVLAAIDAHAQHNPQEAV